MRYNLTCCLLQPCEVRGRGTDDPTAHEKREESADGGDDDGL